MREHRISVVVSVRPITTVALTMTLGVAAAAWVIAAARMTGMDMGARTELGSLGSFALLWMAMMAAMMLPGAAPAIAKRAQTGGGRAATVFLVSYLAVWAVVGLAIYAVYRPHGWVSAGAAVIAAGLYELTALKRRFRRRCREDVRTGFEYGACCAGSSIGLMLMLVAIGVMSLAWMSTITVLGLEQKLLPAKPAIDVPVAVAIVGLGSWILVAPGSVPGLM